jgi:hypothetical protein
MTSAFDEAGARDALDEITRMMVGTKKMQDEPGVVYSLMAQKARPQDAQAIDQFMQSLEAEKQVQLARATGEVLNLDGNQRKLLDANGVNYTDVQYSTSTNAATQAADHIFKTTKGAFTAKVKTDGTLDLAPDGSIQRVKVEETHGESHDSGGGIWGAIGSVVGGVKDVGAGALHGLNEGYNFVATGIDKGAHGIADSVLGLGGGSDPQKASAAADAAQSRNTDDLDMRAQGYDPDSIWSTMAFQASGKAHTSLSSLVDSYGQDKIDETLKFLTNPEAYKESIARDPANYTKIDGQTALTPEALDKLKYLGSDEFAGLARRVNAHSATVGNDLANSLGLDPVDHATAYNYFAAGTNIAASFLIDPTLITLQTVKVAKLANIGLDTLADSDKAASILTRKSFAPSVRRVQNGWQTAIDLGAQMRKAHATGNLNKVASLTAEFNAKIPGLAPMMPDFVGVHALLPRSAWGEEIVNGKKVIKPEWGETGGIKSLDEAAQWVKSRVGLTLLMSGRAATQSSLMPGALSAFGYRYWKGATAGWMTGRSAVRAGKAYSSVISRADADPLLAKKLIDDGILARLAPQADDAVNPLTEQTLAEGEQATQTGLASAARGAQYELTSVGKGEVSRNLRISGDALGDATKAGYVSPTAIAARFRLGVQRFSTLLPRNTVIRIDDAASSDKIYKMALTYLNRGDANALRAAWNFGNGGQRKAIIGGLIDQIGHAAGLGKSTTGQAILDRAKTAEENYSSAMAEIELNGQKVALFEGQTRQQWTLPSFQALQQASSKIGLWESTLGRGLTSRQADILMSQWKLGALFKPSTVTRNQLEGWLRTMLDGKAGSAIQARAVATARNKELWDRGYGIADREAYVSAEGKINGLKSMLSGGGLSKSQRADAYAQMREAERVMQTHEAKPIVQHLLATRSGDTKLAKTIEQSSMLSGDVLGRSTVGTKFANLGPLAITGRAYRALMGKAMDEADVEALLTLSPAELTEAMEGYGQQILESDLGFHNAARQASEIAKSGFGPAKVRMAIHRAVERGKAVAAKKGTDEEVRYTHQALDGTLGADRYAHALAQRINSMPETAKAALEYLSNGPGDKSAIIAALEKESKNTAFGKVFFENPDDLTKARDAATAEEAEAGKADWAQKVVDEYGYLFSGQNGEFQSELADFVLEHGHAPDGGWIADHLTGDNRPATALYVDVAAMANGGHRSIPMLLQDIEGGAYQWLVERPLQRTTSSPVFLANYAIARKGLNKQVEQLVAEGFSEEAANNFAKELSTRNAWIKTEQLIDDPGQKTQFDVVARNIFPFARATNAMIRRWGTGLYQNPAAARKMMLAYEGATHSGMIYTNQYGEPTFTYPASGVMNMALRAVSQLPGFENIAAFPVSSSMTGGVLMSVPGADNPFRMSMGPMVSMPLREMYKHLLPRGAEADAMKIDAFINGPIGTGEVWSQLVPTAVRKFWTALDTDDRNSALASSMNGAIANLAAAGLVPTTENADSSVAQQFRDRLQTQVRNQLFLRAVFGLFAPAAPSTPTEATSASGADYAWSVDGIKQLNEEYKAILNETDGDIGRANAIFTALHPDEVVYKTDGTGKQTKLPSSAYETFSSGSNVRGAYMPNTDKALQWMLTNQDFVGQYKSVAAYFLPNDTSGEPFSEAAYKAQLELGLRIRKTPQEFMNDVYVKHAESAFYPSVQEFDRRINDAKASGNDDAAKQLQAQKVAWEKDYQARNPLLKAKIDDYGNARHTASQQLTDLKLMLDRHAVPDGQGPLLDQLVTTYDNYVAFIGQHQGQTTEAKAARANALDMFNRWANDKLTGGPLADVYNGVFRVLNTNLDRVDGGS